MLRLVVLLSTKTGMALLLFAVIGFMASVGATLWLLEAATAHQQVWVCP